MKLDQEPQEPTHPLRILWKRFHPGSTFLDLGCGEGFDALFMAMAGFQVTAVDSSQENIATLKKKIADENLQNIRVVHSDVLDFPIGKDAYSIINSRNLLQFLPKTKALHIIKNIQQAVQQNGFIVLNSFTTDDPSFRASQGKKFKTYFDPQEMLGLFTGLKILFYLENTILDKGHKRRPEPHKHGVVKIIAQKKRDT